VPVQVLPGIIDAASEVHRVMLRKDSGRFGQDLRCFLESTLITPMKPRRRHKPAYLIHHGA
jgi:hypothetical protein